MRLVTLEELHFEIDERLLEFLLVFKIYEGKVDEFGVILLVRVPVFFFPDAEGQFLSEGANTCRWVD